MTDEEKQPKPRKRGKPRRRGAGSVFRRPERKGKQWVAQIILENGRTRQRYFATQLEAEQALNEMLYEQHQGMLATGPSQTLKQLLEHWLEHVQKHAVRVNHYINTRTIIHRHMGYLDEDITLVKLMWQNRFFRSCYKTRACDE